MGTKHGKYLGQEDLQEIVDTSGMDPDMVQQKFADFMRSYPNGKVSKHNFKALISEALPKTKDNMEKLSNHMFRVYDSNNDGYIDFIELISIYHVMTEGTIEDVLGKIFRLFDVNRDGTISVQEMQRLVKDLYKFVETSPDEIVMGVFKEMDTNEDKKISEDEFISACLSSGGFAKLITFKVLDIFNDLYVEKEHSVVDFICDRLDQYQESSDETIDSNLSKDNGTTENPHLVSENLDTHDHVVTDTADKDVSTEIVKVIVNDLIDHVVDESNDILVVTENKSDEPQPIHPSSFSNPSDSTFRKSQQNNISICTEFLPQWKFRAHLLETLMTKSRIEHDQTKTTPDQKLTKDKTMHNIKG